jgi:lipoate-protein ligase B
VVSPVPARVLHLGLCEYAQVWERQLELVRARQKDEIPDTLVRVEHPDVLTMGRCAKKENLLETAGLPVFEIERGGDVTYHGPGQLVGYPIFMLRPEERDLHLYLRRMEEALLLTVADLGVKAGRRPGWTGVWTDDSLTTAMPRKLASIGVAVKSKWVTLHGFALNVSTDLSRFAAINPCGLDAAVMTSLSACLGRTVSLDEAGRLVVQKFAEVFGRDFGATEATS